jgi:ATP-dependent protease ClpP protease subunit
MLKFLISAFFCTYAAAALCGTIDFKKTKANVTYEASTFWLGGIGPAFSSTIKIHGEINRDAIELVRRYYETLAEVNRRYAEEIGHPESEPLANFQLDSPGGNVEAGIELGRFIREKKGNVLVIDGAACASTCVLVFAGGATRHVNGKLGIHRVFINTSTRTMTADDIKKTMALRLDQLRAYFREMNISERLADDMMVIPSTNMKWLSAADIEIYGLGVDDPVIQEANALKNARKYGLTRMEYERRWQIVREVCALSADTPDNCEDLVMTGKYPGGAR